MQLSSLHSPLPVWTLQLHSFPRQHPIPMNLLEFRVEAVVLGFRVVNLPDYYGGEWAPMRVRTPNDRHRKLVLRAFSDPAAGGDARKHKQHQQAALAAARDAANLIRLKKTQNPIDRLQDTIASIPPLFFSMKKYFSPSFTVGLCTTATLLLLALRSYATRKSRYSRPGSVADLVHRGQLRTDRRGISTPLMYDDPFNNPMVKVGKSNSTAEMCGKVYRLAPVTLTKEQQAIHQKRRSRAYQWKRPKVFLREGDSVPPDVDPDTVRWIPANHPFATTASDIDEDLAQNNVYQKHGVPFRIQAEHEALQRKLEALQSEQKLDKLVIDPGAAKDFERPYKSHLKSDDSVDKNSWDSQMGSKHSSNSDSVHNSLLNRPASEEIQKP